MHLGTDPFPGDPCLGSTHGHPHHRVLVYNAPWPLVRLILGGGQLPSHSRGDQRATIAGALAATDWEAFRALRVVLTTCEPRSQSKVSMQPMIG